MSSGSCHRAKAAAFRREFELLPFPVGSLPTSVVGHDRDLCADDNVVLLNSATFEGRFRLRQGRRVAMGLLGPQFLFRFFRCTFEWKHRAVNPVSSFWH